jgi:transposase InsO family protein
MARTRSGVTDITEHPAREGKLCCRVVLDAYSRRVVGWAIAITCLRCRWSRGGCK